MTPREARQLMPGDKIRTDEGDTVHVKQDNSDAREHENVRGVPYVWILTSRGVWPSNRLGR